MKISRNTLLIIIAALGVFLIIYTLIRQFIGIGISESMEKHIFDGIIIIAIVLFVYNRNMAQKEKQARIAEEEAKRKTMEEQEEDISEDNEDLPHWERYKDNTD